MRQLTKGNQLQNQGLASGGQGTPAVPTNGQQQKNQQNIQQNQQQNQQNQLQQQQQAGGYSKYQDMKRIEDYTFCLSDMVGKGASGTVYLGENIVSKEVVAIKDEYTWGLICSEIDFMKKLKCENVVRLIDVFQTQNNAYIVTELCEDGDLVDYMKRNVNKIRQNQAVKIITDILRGLQELAKHGIIHRDLKPANILISKKDTFKITDFGFARMVEKNDYLMTSLVGTPLYMSPQILKRQMYTSKCDVWSIGLIFYELIYGQTPWPSNSVIDLVNNMFTNPLKFPTSGQAGDIILEGVKDFIRSCLKFEENDRLGWDEVYKHVLFKDALYTTQKNANNQNTNSINNQQTFYDERGSQIKSPNHQRDSQNKKGSFSTSFQTSFMSTLTNAGANTTATKIANSKGNSNPNQNSSSSSNKQNNNQKNQSKAYPSSNQNQTTAKGNTQSQGSQLVNNTSNLNGQSTISSNTTNFNSTGNTTVINNNNVTTTSTSSSSSNNNNINNNPNNNNLNNNNSSSQTNIQQNTSLGGAFTNLTVINLNQQQTNSNSTQKLYSKQNSRQNTPSLQKQQISQPTPQIGALNINEGKLCENSSQSTPRQQPAKVSYAQSMMKQISNQQSNGVTSTGSFICSSSQPQNLGNSGNNFNLSNNGQQQQNIPNNRQSNIVSPTIKDKRPTTNQNGLFGQYQNSSFLQQYQLQGQSQNKLETIRQQYKKQVADKKSTDFIYIQGSNHNLTSDASMNNHFNPANNHSAVCNGSSDRGINEKGITGTTTSQSSVPFNFIHKRQKSARDVAGNYNQNNFYIPLASPTKNPSSTDKHRILTEPNQINDLKDTYSPNKNSMIFGGNRESNLQSQNQNQQNQYNSSSPLSTEPSQNPVPTVLITLGSMNQLPNVSQNNNGEQLQSPPKINSGHMLNFSNDQSLDQESPMNSNNQYNQVGKMGFGLINLESTNIGTPDKNIAVHIKPGFYQQKGYQKNNTRSITPTMTASAHKTISPNTSNNTPKMSNADTFNLANSKKALSNFNKFATAVYNSEERGSKLIPSNNNQGVGNSQSSNGKRVKLNNRLSSHKQQQQASGSMSSSSIQQKLSQSKRNMNNDIVNNSNNSKNFDLFKTADQILTYGSMCGNDDDTQYSTGSPKNASKKATIQQFSSSFIQNASNKPHNYIQLTLNTASNQGPIRSAQGQYQSEKKTSQNYQTSSQSPSYKVTGQNNMGKQNFPSHQYKSYDFSSHIQQNPISSGSFIGQLNGSGMSSQPVPRNSSSGNGIQKDIKFEESIDGKIEMSDRSPTNILNNPIINLNRRDVSNSSKQNITQVNLNYPLIINTKQQPSSQSYIVSPATNSSNVFSQLYNQELGNQLLNQNNQAAVFNFSGQTQGIQANGNQPVSENNGQSIQEFNSQGIILGSNNQVIAGPNSVLGNIQTEAKSIIPIDLKKTQQEFYSPQVKNQKFIFEGSNQTQLQHSNTTTNQSQIGGLSSAVLQNSLFKIQKTPDFTSYQNNYMQQEGNSSIDILNNYQNFCKFLFNLVRIINNSNFDKNPFLQSNFIIEKVTFILLKNCMMKLTRINEKLFSSGENIFNLSDWSSFKSSSKFTEFQTSFFLMQTEIQSSFDQEYNKSVLQSKYQQSIAQDYPFTQLFNKDMTDDVRFYSISLTFIKQFTTILNLKLSQNPSSSLSNPNPIITEKNDLVVLALIDDFIEYHDMMKTNLINMDSFHQQVFTKFNQFLMKCNNAYNYLTLCSRTCDFTFIANLQQKIKEFGL